MESRERWFVRECEHGHLTVEVGGFLCPVCTQPLGAGFDVVRASNVRARDPGTSRLASLANAPHRDSQRSRVLEAIRRAGERGLTAREAERVSGVDRAGRRVSELKQGGHIVARGTRVDASTGALAEVFVAAGVG